MKKIILLISISLTTICAVGQTNPIIGTYTQDVDSMFQHLDKSGISTGILYDRVFPFANLPFYHENPGQPDTIDFSFFIQASIEFKEHHISQIIFYSRDYFYVLKTA